MIPTKELDRSTWLARVVAFALTVSLVGCASLPDNGPPRTPYKGDAVYNIASGSGQSRDARAETTSLHPSVG